MIEEENKEKIIKVKDIVLLKDVEVEFVSLVNYAANQSPFKIIKSVKGDLFMENFIGFALKKGASLQEVFSSEEEVLKFKEDFYLSSSSMEEYDIYLKKDYKYSPEEMEICDLPDKSGIYGILFKQLNQHNSDVGTVDNVDNVNKACDIDNTDNQNKKTVKEDKDIYSVLDSLYNYFNVISGLILIEEIPSQNKQSVVFEILDALRSGLESYFESVNASSQQDMNTPKPDTLQKSIFNLNSKEVVDFIDAIKGQILNVSEITKSFNDSIEVVKSLKEKIEILETEKKELEKKTQDINGKLKTNNIQTSVKKADVSGSSNEFIFKGIFIKRR